MTESFINRLDLALKRAEHLHSKALADIRIPCTETGDLQDGLSELVAEALAERDTTYASHGAAVANTIGDLVGASPSERTKLTAVISTALEACR